MAYHPPVTPRHELEQQIRKLKEENENLKLMLKKECIEIRETEPGFKGRFIQEKELQSLEHMFASFNPDDPDYYPVHKAEQQFTITCQTKGHILCKEIRRSWQEIEDLGIQIEHLFNELP